MLAHRFGNSIVRLVILLAVFAAPGNGRAAERRPRQIYNRMIYIRVRDGAETFVNVPDHYDVGSPSISPDGKSIAFDANTIGRRPVREAWLVDSDGNNLRKLTDASCPRWSPDGKQLLMSRLTIGTLTARYDVLNYDMAAKKEAVICEGRFPDWSPDGKKIVFAKDGLLTANSGEHPGSKLWIARADGTSPEELCDGNWPSWSPDGRKIAFCVQEEGKPNEIWTIDLDTKARTKIALGFYRAQWDATSKHFLCNGSILVPGGTTYARGPAMFSLDSPLQPHFFSTNLDNPWSPCGSHDGKMLVLVVDSQKRRGESEEK